MAYSLGTAHQAQLAALPDIERAAAKLFADEDVPASLLDEATEIETFAAAHAAGRLQVAVSSDGQPVGFALAELVDGKAHLQELDVHPEHGRRGLGRRLVEATVACAREQGHGSLTLTTFSNVAWNRPYYERLGFRVLDASELAPELAELLREEAEQGLRNRVAMIRPIAPLPDS